MKFKEKLVYFDPYDVKGMTTDHLQNALILHRGRANWHTDRAARIRAEIARRSCGCGCSHPVGGGCGR